MFDAAFAAQDAAVNLAATAASPSSKDMAVPREWVYGAFVFMGLAVIGMATDAKKTYKDTLKKLGDANDVIDELREEIRTLQSDNHQLQTDLTMSQYKYEQLISRRGR